MCTMKTAMSMTSRCNVRMAAKGNFPSGPATTRYYQGMIDMDELKKGQYYTALKESFIIFICTFDPFGENLPMYTFRHRCIEKEGLELGDLSTKIFLNAKVIPLTRI